MSKEVEEYSFLVHAAQAFAYFLGYRYHRRRGNKLYKYISVVGLLFHSMSALRHLEEDE